MKKNVILLFFVFPLTFLPLSLMAETTVKSPEHRTVLLELYTSEGCSSCPPADRFLSKLKNQGIAKDKIIPLAFHVTYWDYIGWKDRFAKTQFDNRQRDLARKTRKSTVYTPQFVFSGKDFRLHSRFNDSVNKFVEQKSEIDLTLTINKKSDKLSIKLASDVLVNTLRLEDIELFIAVLESNLGSQVLDGENHGKALQHDYVVRQLTPLYKQKKRQNKLHKEHIISLSPDWKIKDLSIIAFAENTKTGEILQAVKFDGLQ